MYSSTYYNLKYQNLITNLRRLLKHNDCDHIFLNIYTIGNYQHCNTINHTKLDTYIGFKFCDYNIDKATLRMV